jgi:hypothetical protein
MRPEDFPIGSPESRAAARAMLEARERGIPHVQLIIDFPRPGAERDTTVGPWCKTDDGTLIRTVTVPPGTEKGTIQPLLATP